MSETERKAYWHETDAYKLRGVQEGFSESNPPHSTMPYVFGPENTPRPAPPIAKTCQAEYEGGLKCELPRWHDDPILGDGRMIHEVTFKDAQKQLKSDAT